MKEVHKDIEVRKGGDVSVFQEVTMGDEVMVEEVEGDSVLRKFLLMLNAMMRQDKRKQNFPFGVLANRSSQRDLTNDFFDIVNIDASTSPITLGFDDAMDDYAAFDFGDKVAKGVFVGGIDGNDALNGFHYEDATRIGDDSYEISVPTTGNEDISFAKGIPIYDLYGSFEDEHLFDDPSIFLGQSTLSNTTGQIALNLPLVTGSATGQIDYGGTTLNTPVIDLNQQISTITVSRDVTNQTNSDIPVEELGLYARAGIVDSRQWGFFFLGRDLLSTAVPSKTTITFNYKFRTTCETSGGILVQFNELLYRQLANADRTVQDVFNNNWTDSAYEGTFSASVGGGYDRPKSMFLLVSGTSMSAGEWAGIQVGKSTQVVDEADFNLKDRLSHGNATGEMFYHGQSINYVEEDAANDRYYFDVVRFFENRSGSSIDVGEVGFNVSPRDSDQHVYTAQIFRHQVNPVVTVATTELLKVTYRVSVKPKA